MLIELFIIVSVGFVVGVIAPYDAIGTALPYRQTEITTKCCRGQVFRSRSFLNNQTILFQLVFVTAQSCFLPGHLSDIIQTAQAYISNFSNDEFR